MCNRVRRRAVARLSFALACAVAAPLTSQELVTIANVTGVEPGAGVPSIERQTRVALERLGARLEALGLGYLDVVSANVFLADERHFAGMNGVYREFFTSDPPTRATVAADLPDPDALIQISVVATSDEKEVVTPRDLRSPELPYSWGIRVGATLFVAGATSRNPDTYQPQPGDIAAQTHRVFGNIEMVLREAGMGSSDLVSCRVFLGDSRRFGEMNAAYREHVPAGDPPARATVRAGLMNLAFGVEIQCRAERSGSRSVVRPGGAPASSLPYSPGIDTGGWVHLAGMVGRGDGIEAQTSDTLDRLEAALSAAGLGFGDVVDTWVYVADVRDVEAVRTALSERLPEGLPEPTLVGTPLAGRGGVEIQMTARRR